LSLELGHLGLLIELLPQVLAVTPQSLDLLLAFEQLALVVLVFAGNHAHLVLHVAEVEALLLDLLPHGHQLLSLSVKLSLQLVHVRVEHGDALL
jgi:hypothetical protein